MSNLRKHSIIQREHLNETYYFQSLLEESYRLNLLTVSEFERIQLQSVQLLAKQTERYTGGESSSIKVETAQSLMQSIFYCIGRYLKNYPDMDGTIEALKHKPLSELFRNGKIMIVNQLSKARELLKTIEHDRFVTDNQAYHDTVQNGLPGFFAAYDADYAAHDTPGSIDYPLGQDISDLAGIEYIYSYLYHLNLENEFCTIFPTEQIESLLQGYNEHYQELLINIFELVLINSIGSVLAGKHAFQLNIEPSDRQNLHHILLNLSQGQLKEVLKTALNKLYQDLQIENVLLQKYISETISELPARILHAVQTDQLESIIISLKEKNTQPVFQFEDGQKLSDESFRKVVDEIRACRYVSDKISIIQREIHSFIDLVDLLEGYCLFDQEFIEVFQSLGDIEVALLVKRLPKDMIGQDLHHTENEKEWHNRLRQFLGGIDSSRKEKIMKMCSSFA